MKMAIGMVAAMVNVPHGLPFSAFTTTSEITANRMIIISSTVTSAMKPPTLPISSRAICPSDLPSRRMVEALGEEALLEHGEGKVAIGAYTDGAAELGGIVDIDGDEIVLADGLGGQVGGGIGDDASGRLGKGGGNGE